MASLPWRKIDDKEFELISKALAEMLMPEVSNWDLYLKSGNKQHGIDIYGWNHEAQKHYCVQCKFTLNYSLTESYLREWITEFEKGQFLNTTKKFIIITTYDSQKKVIRDFFDQEVQRFSSEYSIELELWDLTNLEQKMKSYYRLVLEFFGKHAAEDHCHSENRHPIPKYPPIENYLRREILKIDQPGSSEWIRFYVGQEKKIDPKNIFLNNYASVKKICLIADAYQGKSTVLNQLAFELAEGNIYVPILINVKSYNVQPIDSIIDKIASYWKYIPTKDLVIIIDGLDEVPKDKFIEAAKNIFEFSSCYPAINVVYSCRKLFHNHFRLTNEMEKFEQYELYPLSDLQIDEYLKILKGKKKSFLDYVKRSHLSDLLSHPFYLTKLTQHYKDISNLTQLPKNKREILDFLLEESFTPSKSRNLSGGSLLEHERHCYNIVIKRLALACQLIGVNALCTADIDILFSPKEKELLTHSSFLTHEDNQWTFESSFFQENLAASLLMDIPFDDVRHFITVGRKYRKIKSKWLQTATSLISLLDDNDPRNKELLSIIENDNVELLVFCDATKFNGDFRLSTVRKIVEKCIRSNSFPRLASIEAITDFVKGLTGGLDYLLNMEESLVHPRAKAICWNLVYHYDRLYNYEERVIKRILFNLEQTNDEHLASLLVKILTKFKMADDLINKEIVGLKKMKLKTEYINSVLELFISQNLVDEYYEFGLEAIEIFENSLDRRSQYGFQTILTKFLLKCQNPYNVLRFLTKISGMRWSAIFDSYELKENKNNLLSSICDMVVQAYLKTPSILLPVTTIAKNLLLLHTDNYKQIISFFEKTKTDWLFFRLCVQDKQIGRHLLASIIDENGVFYVFDEYEFDRFTVWELEGLYNNLSYQRGGEKITEIYYCTLNVVTGSQIKELLEKTKLENENLDQKKFANDLKYIQSSEAFMEGVQDFFRIYGADTVPRNHAFVGYSNDIMRRESDSSFFGDFFLHFEDEHISFSQCQALISQKNFFRDFQAVEILGYRFPDEISKNTLLPLLKQYYDIEIKRVEFVNSIQQHGGGHWIPYKQDLLKRIFTKYGFETTEDDLLKMLWLICDGFNHLKPSIFNSESSWLSKMIIERVDDEKLRLAILNNIKEGIIADTVLKSHLEFCRHLGISEILEFILSKEIFERFNQYDKEYLVEVFIDLGGEKSHLLEVFKKVKNINEQNEYIYTRYAKILIDDFPIEVCELLLQALNDAGVGLSVKMDLAILLMRVGEEVGFSFFVDNIANISFEQAATLVSIDNLSTQFALTKLHKIRHHLMDANLVRRQMRDYSIKNLFIDMLLKLSNKSEDDLILVESFMNDAYHEFQLRPNASDILYETDRIIESFRASDKSVYTIHDIKNIFSTLQ